MPIKNQAGYNNGGYSGLDFSSVGQELAWWLNPAHITQTFKGGWSGSGENGIDIGLPHGTPVYSIVPGTVVGANYYDGGGVVAVQYDANNIFYYQHLDLVQTAVGDRINTGQQIGLSGGQLVGGNHPSTAQYSSGDHIEVGINAPYGGMWNPNNVKPNVDPLPALEALLGVFKQGDVQTGSVAAGFTSGDLSGVAAATSAGAIGKHCWNLPFGLPPFCVSNTTYNWVTQPIRWLKAITGVLLMTAGFLLFLVPIAGGPALMATGVATGQPELVAAGAAIRGGKARKKQYAARVARRAATHNQQSNAQAAKPAAPPKKAVGGAQPAQAAAATP